MTRPDELSRLHQELLAQIERAEQLGYRIELDPETLADLGDLEAMCKQYLRELGEGV